MNGTAAVVGVGESAYYRPGGAPDTEFQLAVTAIKKAVADAGISLKDIDGFVSYANDRNDPLRLSAQLGNDQTRFSAMSWGGGGNGVGGAIILADAAITAGYANYVVAFRSLAQGQFGRFGQARSAGRPDGMNAFRTPYGLASAAMWYAMVTKRYMYEYGLTEDALCEVSLNSYANAQNNRRAIRFARPITREDYYASRWIVEPYRLFDCCQENDGAAAVVITSAERARDLPHPPAYIRAGAQGMEYRGSAGGGLGAGYTDPEFPTAHFRTIAKDLWERAGVGPKDVQVGQFYENFTGMVVMALAEMGFSEPNEIEAWLKNGNIRFPNGSLPINTSGGNLAEAYIHGFELVLEAVRQVRGEAINQVPNVQNSLVVAGPGALPASAVLFSKEP
jgi:acetyl-CoA acetyltransferase